MLRLLRSQCPWWRRDVFAGLVAEAKCSYVQRCLFATDTDGREEFTEEGTLCETTSCM